ncbi:MAG TPA: YciI family protein [Jatrophihabitans sp.]|nr:YciI family protein [Jatrophihabitans sp.]
MQYALLIYGRPDAPRATPGPIDDAIAEVLARPYVTGWARLHSDESSTTLRTSEGKSLLTDGPFIDSKEYLAGLIMIEAENLDGALDVAQELQDARTGAGAIEVRPVIEGLFRGA